MTASGENGYDIAVSSYVEQGDNCEAVDIKGNLGTVPFFPRHNSSNDQLATKCFGHFDNGVESWLAAIRQRFIQVGAGKP